MAILLAACLSGPKDRVPGDPYRATGDHLPYQQPGNDTWHNAVFWRPLDEVSGFNWPVNDTLLEEYPVLGQMIELGKLLEYERYGRGYFDAFESYRFCEYAIHMGWQYPDGNNGTMWRGPTWELDERVYWFTIWSSDNEIAC